MDRGSRRRHRVKPDVLRRLATLGQRGRGAISGHAGVLQRAHAVRYPRQAEHSRLGDNLVRLALQARLPGRGIDDQQNLAIEFLQVDMQPLRRNEALNPRQ